MKNKTKSIHLFHHVKAHPDNYKRQEDLPLEAQLNCRCHDKAKETVIEGIVMAEILKGATLPLESASVFIKKNKQTTDLTKGLRYYIGKATAQDFYAKTNNMDKATLDMVTGEDLRDTLALKLKMYQLWCGK